MSNLDHIEDTRAAIVATLLRISYSRALLASDRTAQNESMRAIRGSRTRVADTTGYLKWLSEN